MTKTKSYRINRAQRECTVVIENLAVKTTSEELIAAFKHIGECSVTLLKPTEHTAELQFHTREKAKQAIEKMNNFTIRQRELSVTAKPAAPQNSNNDSETRAQAQQVNADKPARSPQLHAPVTASGSPRKRALDSKPSTSNVTAAATSTATATVRSPSSAPSKSTSTNKGGIDHRMVRLEDSIVDLHATINTVLALVKSPPAASASPSVVSTDTPTTSASGAGESSVNDNSSKRKRARRSKSKASEGSREIALNDSTVAVKVTPAGVTVTASTAKKTAISKADTITPTTKQQTLCCVEIVRELRIIDGVTNMVMATVMGWSVAVHKDDFRIGDACVYVPIDTLIDISRPHFQNLPGHPATEALGEALAAPTLYKLQTVEVTGGVYSQGVALPEKKLNELAELAAKNDLNVRVNSALGATPRLTAAENMDVLLGVTKYSKEMPKSSPSTTGGGGLAEGEVLKPLKGKDECVPDVGFPTDIIPISDEPHLRSNTPCLAELERAVLNGGVYVSKKMDGQSMTIILDDQGKFSVCSRKRVCGEGSVLLQFVKKAKLESRVRKLGYPIALQCEFCGPEINQNPMRLRGYEVFVFTAKKLHPSATTAGGERTDMCVEGGEDGDDDVGDDPLLALNGTYCGMHELQSVCAQLDMRTTPVLRVLHASAERDCDKRMWTVDELQEYADGTTYTDPTTGELFPAEGVVVRPVVPVWSQRLKAVLSVKVLNRRYKD